MLARSPLVMSSRRSASPSDRVPFAAAWRRAPASCTNLTFRSCSSAPRRCRYILSWALDRSTNPRACTISLASWLCSWPNAFSSRASARCWRLTAGSTFSSYHVPPGSCSSSGATVHSATPPAPPASFLLSRRPRLTAPSSCPSFRSRSFTSLSAWSTSRSILSTTLVSRPSSRSSCWNWDSARRLMASIWRADMRASAPSCATILAASSLARTAAASASATSSPAQVGMPPLVTPKSAPSPPPSSPPGASWATGRAPPSTRSGAATAAP
mmetsp:Transcript_22139/g.62849  ORF Transcript_22139/g.62849 Transcript_22139/m.62849 type:complete len:270 (+) Transcript_22139:278-1087(+)